MGRLIGYARVSTAEQDLSLQLEALQGVGCGAEQIFLDTASGARTARPGLEACLQVLAPGDTLVVWRLDRLGRSMAHLVSLIEELRGRHVGFRSLGDGAIDTTTAAGELVFRPNSNGGSFRSARRRGSRSPARAAKKGGVPRCVPKNHVCGWRIRWRRTGA
jgi:DNA invertase Pin-like site-specific DNA recombinase